MKINSEADVIQLIGLNTPLQFKKSWDGMFSFRTLIEDLEENFYYEVTFYIDENSPATFYLHDSFSKFLIDFQIESLRKIWDFKEEEEVLFFREYNGG